MIGKHGYPYIVTYSTEEVASCAIRDVGRVHHSHIE